MSQLGHDLPVDRVQKERQKYPQQLTNFVRSENGKDVPVPDSCSAAKWLGQVFTQRTPLNNHGQGDGNYHQADGEDVQRTNMSAEKKR